MAAHLGTASAVDRALHSAAEDATLAPSVHNTQPWLMVVGPTWIDVRADRSRGLAVLDPTGRDLEISCGAAVTALSVSLTAAGLPSETTLLPDPADPDLLARVSLLTGAAQPTMGDLVLAAAIGARHSNRRPFLPLDVTATQLQAVLDAGRGPDVWVSAVVDPDRRVAVTVLVQHAEDLQTKNDGYRDELAAWTDREGTGDGIPAAAVPAHGSGGDRGDVPIRDFAGAIPEAGGLPARTQSNRSETLLVVGTDGTGDDTRDHLLAGAAMMRVLLQATAEGLVCSLLTGVTEVPFMRARLRVELDTIGVPQVVLRMGVAESVAPTPRRPLTDSVVDSR